MKQRKPRAYLTRECNGWFLLHPTIHWVARDRWDNFVAYGSTKKEYESECRERGYVPV